MKKLSYLDFYVDTIYIGDVLSFPVNSYRLKCNLLAYEMGGVHQCSVTRYFRYTKLLYYYNYE